MRGVPPPNVRFMSFEEDPTTGVAAASIEGAVCELEVLLPVIRAFRIAASSRLLAFLGRKMPNLESRDHRELTGD